MYCFINDQFRLQQHTGFPVDDLAVQRGYGIFDYLRVSNKVPLFINNHLDRFFYSAKEMRLSVPYALPEIKNIVASLIEKNDLSDAGIRIILSGGASPDGYQIVQPNLVILAEKISIPGNTISSKGYHLISYPHQRQLAQVKTTDYQMAIWLKPRIIAQGGDDVIYHQGGMITECPRSNIFMVSKTDTLLTPCHQILKGITRKVVLTLAEKNGIAVEERDISLDELKTAKEVFITSSTKRLIPVASIDQHALPVFSQGSLTAKLYEYFFAYEKNYIADHQFQHR